MSDSNVVPCEKGERCQLKIGHVPLHNPRLGTPSGVASCKLARIAFLEIMPSDGCYRYLYCTKYGTPPPGALPRD